MKGEARIPDRYIEISGPLAWILEETGLELRVNQHPKSRANLMAALMYEAYKDGKSLAEIAKRFGKSRQAVYDVLHSRGYPLRSKKLKGRRLIDGVQFTFDANGYLRGSKDGRRVYAHKMAWEKMHGPIPSDFCLTFIDGDRENVAVSNLELVPVSHMSRRFNPDGHNQYTR